MPPPPNAEQAPHAADEIAAGTAGRGAVAGLGAGTLGAAGFGALKLDFDTELPPSPAQPLPAFTPADLARIARNKLDLAAEYIELGDLGRRAHADQRSDRSQRSGHAQRCPRVALHARSVVVKRIALGIQYDGSAFCGMAVAAAWQHAVQDELERALRASSHRRAVHTVVAGRTDTGVHGLGQVVHFDTELERADVSWVRGTNTFLPKTISVQWAKPMPEAFHARFSAFERTYYYLLYVHRGAFADAGGAGGLGAHAARH